MSSPQDFIPVQPLYQWTEYPTGPQVPFEMKKQRRLKIRELHNSGLASNDSRFKKEPSREDEILSPLGPTSRLKSRGPTKEAPTGGNRPGSSIKENSSEGDIPDEVIRNEEKGVEFITESLEKLSPLSATLPQCQTFKRIVDHTEVHLYAVMGINSLSEMYPCQIFKRIVGNSDVKPDDLMAELRRRKDWDGQFREQLRLWLIVRTTGTYNFDQVLNPVVLTMVRRVMMRRVPMRRVMMRSRGPEPDNSWLPRVLLELWTRRPLGSFPGKTLQDSTLGASLHGVQNQDSKRGELEEGFQLPAARSPPSPVVEKCTYIRLFGAQCRHISSQNVLKTP